MATQSLLLCQDPTVVGVLGPMLVDLGLAPAVCSAHHTALAMLAERKFNPVIIDCDQGDASRELLRSLRESPANHDAVALGIIADDTQVRGAFDMGANLVLRKPLSTDEARRVLRTARGLVTRMRRRFLRYVVHTLAYVHLDGMDDTPMLLDISEGGLAIQALEPLEQRRAYGIRFSLPGVREGFEAVAAVVWADSSARAGLRFLGMPVAARERLTHWLEQQGSAGPAEPDACEPEFVHLPLQLAPATHRALSLACDLLMVMAGVGMFGAVWMLLQGEATLPPKAATAALLLGCAWWLLYRYVFFGLASMTPGSHLAAALADRCAAWMYNRRLSHS